MKGLLIKDFRLMKNMKNSIVLILLIAVGMTYSADTTFIITYLSIIGATFTSSTISYDEFDNGYSFLFSLPVTRRGYAAEKYLFGLCMSGGMWLVGSVVATVSNMARNTMPPHETIAIALTMLPVMMVILAVLIPFHLKFGGEKGRIVMVAVMGLVFLVVVAGAKVAKSLRINLDAIGAGLPAMSMGASIAVAIAVGVALLILSCQISMRIMEKQEF